MSDTPEEDSEARAEGARDVVVPLRVYKAVTVFSTLFAVVFVLAGFVLLFFFKDTATAEICPLVYTLSVRDPLPI